MQQIIDVNPIEPVRIGFRQAHGAAFRCDFTFLTPGAVDEFPQLVFRPRSKGGASAYDLVTDNPAAGTAHVDVPGVFFNDPNGYIVELYTRDAEGHPTRLIAHGEMALTGGAYAYDGPLGPASLPTGPVGPAGPAGVAGQPGPAGAPGSIWTTGIGAPVTAGSVTGDMYLDTATGNVWRWTGASWAIV